MSNTPKTSRRALLKSVAASTLMLPFAQALAKKQNHTLILIELQGGNDGLNTVIPYTNPLYFKYRPTLAMQENERIAISSQYALHNSLEPLMPLWQAKKMAIYLGLGYPNPNRSHFRSIEIWDTASKSDEYLDDGWLKTILVETYTHHRTANGLILGGQAGPLSGTPQLIELKNLKQFSRQTKNITTLQTENENTQNHALRKLINTQQEIEQASVNIQKNLKPLRTNTEFGNHPFAKQMAVASQAIQSNLNIPVIKTSLKSFDTHSNQKYKHKRLLKILAENISLTQQALELSGDWKNITIMTYSEFGRRAKENGTKGTDHGTAAPHFIIGGSIKGGIYGKQPGLEDLDNNDLKYTTDFNDLFNFAKKQLTS
jgi:uncharacterized protein (DUF1501 family)